MDQDLVVRVQHGDRRAFEALAAADYPRLFQVAHGVLSDRSLAEDVTQQALLDIWRDIRRLRDPARYAGWSYRLHFLMDLTPEEVAEALGISRWTVYSRLQAATKSMRAALEADARAVAPTAHRQGALR